MKNNKNKKDLTNCVALCRQLETKKAENVVLYDLSEKSFVYEYVIVCTCLNARHLDSLSAEIAKYIKENDIDVEIHHIEGNDASGWILIDCYNFVINLFTENERERLKFDEIFLK